jgi:DNA-binding response OmpR family regulator
VRRAGTVTQPSNRGKIEVPGLVIDYDLHCAMLDGHDAALTRTEFRLLSVLASERGRAMTRDQLQQRVWGVPYRPRDRSVDVCVRKLREKLDHRSAEYDYIHTHYGVGYRFDAILKDSGVSATA